MDNESAHAPDKRLLFEHDLIESHELVYRTVLSWTHNEEETENLVQEAYLRTWQYMADRQWTVEISNIPAFIIGTARNLRNDWWRRRVRDGWESLDDKSSSDDPAFQDNTAANVENRIYLNELRQIIPLQVILRGLSDHDLRILYLAAAEGMSMAEIAEEVGGNIDSLRYNLQKVYAKVRYRARRYLEETDTKSLFKGGA